MFSRKHLLYLAVVAAATIFSCKKDAFKHDELQSSSTSGNNSGSELNFRSEDLDDKLIVLGQKRNKPYTVANMTTAWNNLYDPDYTALPATHLYVRFLPQNMEELKVLYDLEDTQGLDFDDYPLEYEILEDGDYYHDPSIPEDRPT